MTLPDNQTQQDQSESELESVTGNIPSIIAPEEPFNPSPTPEITPATPQPEIPTPPTPAENPSIPPPAPSPIDPSTPTELPPYVDPVPKDPNNLYC